MYAITTMLIFSRLENLKIFPQKTQLDPYDPVLRAVSFDDGLRNPPGFLPELLLDFFWVPTVSGLVENETRKAND